MYSVQQVVHPLTSCMAIRLYTACNNHQSQVRATTHRPMGTITDIHNRIKLDPILSLTLVSQLIATTGTKMKMN